MVDGQERAASEVLPAGRYHSEYADDLEMCEWFVPVRWLDTVDEADAVREIGVFGNQTTVAAPRAGS